jgi:hypothetical protein
MLPYRHNNRWNINELLSLHREYELLEMTIQEIAAKHERTIEAILYRLQLEQFIETWIDARGYQEYSKTQPCIDLVDHSFIMLDNDTESETELDSNELDSNENSFSVFNKRMLNIESSVSYIKGMLNTFITKFNYLQNEASCE